MDFLRQGTEHSAAVRIVWSLAVGTVLPSRIRDGRESALDATAGRAVRADAVLRGAKDGLVGWTSKDTRSIRSGCGG